jgi:NTE family protein
MVDALLADFVFRNGGCMTRTNFTLHILLHRRSTLLRVGLVVFTMMASGVVAMAQVLVAPAAAAQQVGAAAQQAGAAEQQPAQTQGAETETPAAWSAVAGHKRLSIGLALEGGGALGIAHIGVLKWFEAHHIPVDVIAGTSMGGLVGGLYATGHSPDEIQTLVQDMNWPLVISGQTPYPDLAFRRKEDHRAIPTDLEIGFKKGASIPSGLNAGQQITMVIDKETLNYSLVKSFDNLVIPFRCVSTNLISGKAHMFDSGPVGMAMRATMAFPGVFAPVRQDGFLYVDGALTDNLPTDAARSMHPDIVIAIHLQTSPATANQIQSMFAVLGQSMAIGIAASEARGMENADIVLKADVSKYTAMSYDKTAAMIPIGWQAAEDQAKVLLPYALDEADWDEYIAQRNARKQGPAPTPKFIEVRADNKDVANKIHAFLKPLANKPIDTPKLNNDLTRLTGIGRFDSVGYFLTKRDSDVGLLVVAQDKGFAPPLLQIGFEVNGSQPNDVTFALAGRLTFLDIAGYGSELRNDFSFGNTYGFETEFYKKFTQTSPFFYAPRISASSSQVKLYSHNNPVAEYSFGRAGAGFDLGIAANRFTEVRAGYATGYLNAYLKLGAPEFSSVDGRTGATEFQFTTLRLDDPIIPRKGYAGKLDFQWVDTSPGATSGFPSARATMSYFKPVSKPASVFLQASGGSTIGYHSTGLPQYLYGGTVGWLAYGPNEIRGDQFYLFRTGYLHRLAPLPPFIGNDLYAVTMVEVGKMFGAPGVSRLPMDGAIGAIANTAIGPLFIGGTYGDTGHAKWFFSLGRVF